MHAFRLRKTDRPAYQPLAPRAEVYMLALDLLGVDLPPLGAARLPHAVRRPPAISAIAREATGLQQRFQCEEHRILPSAEDIRSHLACVVINGLP